MIRQEIREWIRQENDAIFDGADKKCRLKYAVVNHHVVEIAKFQKFLRLEYYYRQKGGIYKLLELWYARRKNALGNKLGIYIDCEVFDRGLVIYHHGCIIVNGFARVGRNCKLHGNNCIGNDGISSKAPRIGNNVDIGFGATVIGDIDIADDIVIGAGSVVVDSFYEKGITIAGVPARKIKNKGTNNGT